MKAIRIATRWLSHPGMAAILGITLLQGPTHAHALPTDPLPNATRAITLAPHITELVFAAGAGQAVVATVSSSNYPPEALGLPRVGDGLNINAEQLLTLKPDLLIAWQNSLAMQKLIPILDRLNISVLYSEPRRLDDIPADIERLGALLGSRTVADTTAAGLRKQVSELRHTYARRDTVSIFIEVGTGPLYTLGDDTLTNEAIQLCGGINVFHDSALVAPTITVENVLARNPDVVIIASHTPAHIVQRQSYWRDLRLPAAIQGHVYGMNPDALLRPGPRLIDATRELCHYLDQARQQKN